MNSYFHKIAYDTKHGGTHLDQLTTQLIDPEMMKGKAYLA